MRILYIRREEIYNSAVKRQLKQWRRHLYFSDQDGFFEQSLYTTNTVTEMALTKVPERIAMINQSFDAIVINAKAGDFPDRTAQEAFLRSVLPDITIPKILFLGAAKASLVFSDSYFDLFDLVYKREPFKDRTRYPLTADNQKKIRSTMIYCPFRPQPRPGVFAKTYHRLFLQPADCREGTTQSFDVGFSGSLIADKTEREDAWSAIVQHGFSTIGGLQLNRLHGKAPMQSLSSPRLNGQAYIDAICQAKVNLALEGIGEFTFRHQELWALGAFMISSPSLREIETPLPFEEGVHYVTYDSLPELLDTIERYIQDNHARQKIATAGQTLFAQWYNPLKHGHQIRREIEAL